MHFALIGAFFAFALFPVRAGGGCATTSYRTGMGCYAALAGIPPGCQTVTYYCDGTIARYSVDLDQCNACYENCGCTKEDPPRDMSCAPQ